jgi:hypothetical protein
MNKLSTISSASFNIKVLPKRVHMLLEVLPEYAKGVYPDSPNAVILWLSELHPQFLHVQSKRRNTCGRAWCSPKLFVLGIDRCYQQKHLSYGTPLRLVDQVWNELTQICLMEAEQLEEIFEIARSTFSFLKRPSRKDVCVDAR